MTIELTKMIGRLRRAMPRNADVMMLCDEFDRYLAFPAFVLQPGAINEPIEIKPGKSLMVDMAPCPVCEARRERQRKIMRKRREKDKT